MRILELTYLDTVSTIFVDSNESIQEAKKFFKSKIAYTRPGGGAAFSVGILTLNMTLQYMTGEPIERT